MSWASEIPEELRLRPVGLVVLTGLDTIYNAVHRHIADTFCNNRRGDRMPLNFVTLPADHEYPKSRGRRTTYEFYVPKGILKKMWLKKQLCLVPALVVMFFELDWDDPLWKERQMECATRLQIIRASLQGRSTKVAVVLLQQNMPLPPGEDVVAAERATTFCSVCDLSPKALFVLPQTDQSYGFVVRLENAFYEIVQNYLGTESRRVKAHGELLSKSAHQLLLVRHQFKIAFFNEMKQDTITALKHYRQAYANLMEIPVNKLNATEVKVVAGFLSYKICALSFIHNAPLDAINQIRRHIDTFKNLEGIPELAFEHSAWMSVQFEVFGDLFDDAIADLGLVAIQTQHPGFYYQQAAYHAIIRKKRCLGLTCHPPFESSAIPHLGPNQDTVGFFGQRPWTLQYEGPEPMDVDREKQILRSLQEIEKSTNHSHIIISLLEAAIAHFKKFRCSRIRTLLTVQMGEERYHAGEFSKALLLLGPAAADYRSERWFSLLTSVLTLALKCAYMTASIKDYIAIALEMIGQDVHRSAETKKRIQVNLLKVISGRSPDPETGLGLDHVEGAQFLWQSAWSAMSVVDHGPLTCNVSMQPKGGFVECKVRFPQDKFLVTEKVQVEVYLRLCCQFPMSFSKLQLLFNNSAYDGQCTFIDEPVAHPAVDDDRSATLPATAGDLYLAPYVVKRVLFTFQPRQEDVGKTIEVSAVTLELGQQVSAILRWTVTTLSSPPAHVLHLQRSVNKQKADVGDMIPTAAMPSWNHIIPVISTAITVRKALVDIAASFDGPCLRDEVFAVKYSIRNLETSDVGNVRLSVKSSGTAIAADVVHLSFTEEVAATDRHPVAQEAEMCVVETLGVGQSCLCVLYVKVSAAGLVSLTSQIAYELGTNSEQTCSDEACVVLSVVDAFEITWKVLSQKLSELDNVNADEPFVLCNSIQNISPFDLTLVTSALQPSKYFSHSESAPQLSNITLSPNDIVSECHWLTGEASHGSAPMGTYVVTWKRTSSTSAASMTAVTRVFLPAVAIQRASLFVTASVPSHGVVRRNFLATYTVHNRTEGIQELEAAMESSDVMVYAGHRQLRFKILPLQSHDILYTFFPLVTGHLPLPQLKLLSAIGRGQDDGGGAAVLAGPRDVERRTLPACIFVMPHPRE